MSNFKISHLGHQVSAVIGSVLFARTKSAARIRSAAVLALTGTVFTLTTMGVAEATDLNQYAKNVTNKTDTIPSVITYVSYIAGAGFAATGIVDLKKHVENPTGTPMKNGLAKLGFGGMLLALPMLAGVAQSTTTGNAQAQYLNWGNKPQVN